MHPQGSKKNVKKAELKSIGNFISEANQLLSEGSKKLEYFSEKNHLQFYNMLLETYK